MEPQSLDKRRRFGITNDVEWYKHYPTLTQDAAKVFMSRPNGVDYPALTVGSVPSIHAFKSNPLNSYTKQGGFMRFNVLPTWGATDYLNVSASPLNTAASKLYYYVVHGNSRNISYDKSDLIKCYIAFDSICMVLEEAKRVYKFIKSQSVSNRWVRNIVRGLGWDYDDLVANIVRFRQIINLHVVKLNQISIPDVFDMFKCHAELFRHVYVDRASGKPQFLANVSQCAWIFSDKFSEMCAFTDGVLPGQVRSISWNPDISPRTVVDFEQLISYMIDSLYDSTDIGVIQGDLKRAFSEGQMISVEMLNEEEEVPLLPSLEYNLCMHNAEMWDYFTRVKITEPDTGEERYSVAVIRDTDLMDGNLTFGIWTRSDSTNSGSWHPFGENHVMDLIDDWSEDVDAAILMQKFKQHMSYNSAMKIHAQATETDTHIAAVPISCGPAIIGAATYFYDPTDMTKSFRYNNIFDVMQNDYANTSAALYKLFELGVTLLIIPRYVTTGGDTFAGPLTWEVENITVYNHKVLWNIQNAMIESLWYNSALYNLG